jgi:hypothetical protein
LKVESVLVALVVTRVEKSCFEFVLNTTSTMTDILSQRIVPGAPPPTPLSKTQKKKRKPVRMNAVESPAIDTVSIPDSTSAALIEKAPPESDIKEGSVADSAIAQPERANGTQVSADDSQKPSPMVEIVSKRLKGTIKKIVRHLSLMLV